MEVAKEHFESIGRLILDCCKAIDDVNSLKIDEALQNISKPQDLKDRDAWINSLLVGRKELELWLAKTNKATQVVWMIQNYNKNLGYDVNKAHLFNHELMKVGSISKAKVINIFVNCIAKMDKIVKEMRILVTSLDVIVALQPTTLDKVPILSLNIETLPNLDLLIVEVLHTLSTWTKLTSKNLKAFGQVGGPNFGHTLKTGSCGGGSTGGGWRYTNVSTSTYKASSNS